MINIEEEAVIFYRPVRTTKSNNISYSFITKEAISKTARYEVMYDIFLITHELTPAAELRAFRDLDEEFLAKDPEYRTYGLNEVSKILYKKAKKTIC